MTDDRPPPLGIELVENFLSAEECKSLIELIDSKEAMPFRVRDEANEIQLDTTRVCEWAKVGEDQCILDAVVARAFSECIMPRTGIAIEWYEEPQLLKYYPGGFYQYHTDNGHLMPEQQAWRKAVDRDISMLIYLRDDFEGGELHFKRLNWSLWPKAGMLVWFPSDFRFEHMAKPVTSGTRYALVSWGAAVGVERVQDKRAKRTITLATGEKFPG
ncbi:MAG: 2OG-Fe(II) oxygenase [Gammaproteobacteria bacterium]|nr:2OG-Fe(II) oxygenase [Gammaproteobacteria bacterium]